MPALDLGRAPKRSALQPLNLWELGCEGLNPGALTAASQELDGEQIGEAVSTGRVGNAHLIVRIIADLT